MSLPAHRVGPGRWQTFQFLLGLPRLLRLYGRLLRDHRVALWPKLLLVATVAYVVLPVDFIADTIPLLGQVDDVVLLAAAAHWFLQWCPAAVVREHRDALAAARRA